MGQITKRLSAEGYSNVAGQFYGLVIKNDLRAVIKTSAAAARQTSPSALEALQPPV